MLSSAPWDSRRINVNIQPSRLVPRFYTRHRCSTPARLRHFFAIALSILIVPTQNVAEEDIADFKANVKSAFVWGNDTSGGAVSSILQDPLTGRPLFQLSYGGIDVTSRMGFELVGGGRAGEFIEYATTVVNDTRASVSVQYGGISVDGYSATPPVVTSSTTRTKSLEREDLTKTVSLNTLACFKSGFLRSERIFSAGRLSEIVTVGHGTALTVSSLVKDPRNYSVRCSLNGCFPTGTIRYYLRIGGHDFVFVWPGSSVAFCGSA